MRSVYAQFVNRIVRHYDHLYISKMEDFSCYIFSTTNPNLIIRLDTSDFIIRVFDKLIENKNEESNESNITHIKFERKVTQMDTNGTYNVSKEVDELVINWLDKIFSYIEKMKVVESI